MYSFRWRKCLALKISHLVTFCWVALVNLINSSSSAGFCNQMLWTEVRLRGSTALSWSIDRYWLLVHPPLRTCPWWQPVRKSWVGRRAGLPSSRSAPPLQEGAIFTLLNTSHFESCQSAADVFHSSNVTSPPLPPCNDDSGHTSEEFSKTKGVSWISFILRRCHLQAKLRIDFIHSLWHFCWVCMSNHTMIINVKQI